jgi:hypothetical protein
MATSWTIRRLGDTVVLRRRLGLGDRGAPVSRRELEAWLGGPASRPLLLEICRAAFPVEHPTTVDTAVLLARLDAAIARGDVVAVPTRLAAVAIVPPEPREEELRAAPRTEAQPKTTWIAIRLVDDGSPPRPVPFRRYRVELPDGSTREGTLGEDGTAVVRDIEPGACRVTFPDLAPEAWARA